MINSDDFKMFLDSIAEPVLVAEAVHSTDGEIIDFSVVFINAMYKKSTFDFVQEGNKYSEFKARLPEGIEWCEMAIAVLKTGVTVEKEYLSKRTHTWYHMTMSRAKDVYCVITLENITMAKIKDSTMQVIEKTDLLTGLPNRTCFYDSFGELIQKAASSHTQLGIAILDLDDLKAVNDVSGHSAGDSIIKEGAKILLDAETASVHSFRLGDDEYVVLVSSVKSKESMALFLCDLFAKFQDRHIPISIGASLYPDDELEMPSLIRYADLAMHNVKRNGKNSIKFFENSMYKTFLDRTKLKHRINDAVSRNCFELYFQPQFNIDTNTLRGFEALIRWNDGSNGWISPSEFIPVAEETRSIIYIGRWVLKKALDTLVEWQQNFNFKGIMSVNVSPAQLADGDFYDDLKNELERHDADGSFLELEITEGILISNVEKVIPLLHKIRSLGVQLSLDDFGTGYASLRYLQTLPINTLKVDKSFIDKINAEDDFSISIVKTVVENVSKKGMTTIAEGVEHNEQLNCLKQMHCSCIQGFLWGKPMNKERCERVLSGDAAAVEKI
jgi:diguanylate cyclase (GGDEF)-like protein